MKTFKCSTHACMSSFVVAIYAAGSTLTSGWRWQIVDAFMVNPTSFHHVLYNYEYCQYQRDRLRTRFSNIQVDFSRNLDVTPIRGGFESSRKVLRMNSGDGDDKTSSPGTSLVVQNLANQALLGYPIWSGGDGFTVLSQQAHFEAGALILGIVGVIPMLALSRAIETSESPFVSGLNLSTNMAVLRLFGPTTRPISAFLISLLMATATGIVEETLFRGQSKYCFNLFVTSH